MRCAICKTTEAVTEPICSAESCERLYEGGYGDTEAVPTTTDLPESSEAFFTIYKGDSIAAGEVLTVNVDRIGEAIPPDPIEPDPCTFIDADGLVQSCRLDRGHEGNHKVRLSELRRLDRVYKNDGEPTPIVELRIRVVDGRLVWIIGSLHLDTGCIRSIRSDTKPINGLNTDTQ